MNILVTGTDGYIGALLAPFLVARGHEVVGLDTGFYREGWIDPRVEPFPTQLRKDTRHVTHEDLVGFDAVVHLAELSNDPLGQHNPALTYNINYRASVELARKCKAAGVARFVYSSSCSVYGAGGNDTKTEESATDPQTTYAACKVLVERDVAALVDQSFVPTFLRNATAFGPSPRMRFDIVLNNLAGLAWTTRTIAMTSDGTPWRPLVHVLDICEAMACTLEAPADAVRGQIFNVGSSDQNYRVREIAGIVAETFPNCSVTFGKSDGDNRSYRVSFDKIATRLPGFHCTRDAVIGAEQLRSLFEHIHLTPEQFAFRGYTRIKQLQRLQQTNRLDDQFFWSGQS
jgi:nucleoside-diphosphate-sugar epimerase